MVTARQTHAGFTLTETMVVLVILSILAALSTQLFTRDNNARKGRGWTKIVAQTLQRARFQAMGDRANIHVILNRTRIDMYREQSTGTYTFLSTTMGPLSDAADGTIATWNAFKNRNQSTAMTGGQNAANGWGTTTVQNPLGSNDIVFTPLGGTLGNNNWEVLVCNEKLPLGHPDRAFVISVAGLTGFVSSTQMVGGL